MASTPHPPPKPTPSKPDDPHPREHEHERHEPAPKAPDDGRPHNPLPGEPGGPSGSPPGKAALKPGDKDYDPAKDPDHIVTVQEEQLARSREIEQMGVEAWHAKYSPQPPDEDETKAKKSVPGVAPPSRSERELHHG